MAIIQKEDRMSWNALKLKMLNLKYREAKILSNGHTPNPGLETWSFNAVPFILYKEIEPKDLELYSVLYN